MNPPAFSEQEPHVASDVFWVRTMNEVRIKVRQSGPYLVSGTIVLTDCDGTQYTVEGENIALCRCGGSQTKPFCDGSHRENGFVAVERAAPANPA